MTSTSSVITASSVACSIASVFCLGACSMDEQGVGRADSVAAQLANPTPLPLAVEGSTVFLHDRELPIVSGEVQLGAYYHDGNVLELDALDVAFDTMQVSGQAPGLDGYELRHARVSLAHPVVVPVEWTVNGDAGFANLQVELLLDWSVVGPTGVEVKLATQHLEDVEIELDVYTAADGRLTAVLSGAKPGTFWTWAGIASMGDLHFDLRARR